jgi:hypothetical protein
VSISRLRISGKEAIERRAHVVFVVSVVGSSGGVRVGNGSDSRRLSSVHAHRNRNLHASQITVI